MRKARIEAVEAVRREFEMAEGGAETAAAQGARTIAELLERRASLKLPLDFGLDAIDAIADGMKHAIQSRRAYVQAHAQLAGLPARMGLEKAYGTSCPPNEVFAPFRLSLVEDASQIA